MTNTSIPNAMHAIHAGYVAGKDCAEAIKVGDVFMGAMPEAAKLFPKNSLEFKGFITGYISHLPKDIYCNHDDNRITRIG